MCKKILIPWSGGWDSTYLIFNAIENGVEFETCYFILKNNDKQQKRERKNRKKLKTLIEDLHNISFQDSVFVFTDLLDYKNHIRSGQPFIWLNTLLWNINVLQYSEIQFGYLKTSQVFHLIDAFENFYKNGLKLLFVDRNISDGVAKLSFPLEWYTKELMYENFKSILNKHPLYKKHIIKNLTTCEGYKSKPCGECEKCKEIKNLLND